MTEFWKKNLMTEFCEAKSQCVLATDNRGENAPAATFRDRGRLEDLLQRMAAVRAAVIGDGCLDIYWLSDMRLSELSLETPHFPLPVVEERISPGAGSNVAMNLSQMGCAAVAMTTVIGDDWRSGVWRAALRGANISDEFVIADAGRVTPAYCKPIRRGVSDVQYEDPRIDFANRTVLPERLAKQMSEHIRTLANQVDVLVVSDQFLYGVMTPQVIETVNQLASEGRRCFIDSRHRLGLFQGGVLKPNRLELMRTVHPERDVYAAGREELAAAGKRLQRHTQSAVCATLGEEGVLWVEEETVRCYPAVPVPPPIDIVGAGDAFLAGLAVAFAAGADRDEAVYLATLAASVVLKKVAVTGSATPKEILAAHDRLADSGSQNGTVAAHDRTTDSGSPEGTATACRRVTGGGTP
ncbi:MAG: bifunctional heptose 7-phosphate kinase/heptose 1-phosphate adenyltransferase [Bacilli bacterium]